MFTIGTVLKPDSLEEAWQAAQKKGSAVLGGMLWLRLGNRRIQTAIDLSGLGLDEIREETDRFVVGAYVSLRTMETEPALNDLTTGALGKALSPIVGVQFRNLATVGGSLFGRFGFSDVTTLLTAMDASVELYKGGIVPLEDFNKAKRDKDLLLAVHIPKAKVQAAYEAHRNAATDFPVLNVCAVKRQGELTVCVGARPCGTVTHRFLVDKYENIDVLAENIAGNLAETIVFADNSRGSAAYRRHLCRVLTARVVGQAMTAGQKEE